MSGKAIFAGSLSFINLADVFQVLGGNNGTGRLQITSQYAPAPGVIYFEDGNPVNASAGSVKGLDAIYPLFGWVEGGFEFFEEEIRAAHTIKNSRMQIMLDAMRMMDDGAIEKVGPPSYDEGADARTGKAGSAKDDSFPVVKGPLVDYVYVISEESFREGDRIVKEGGHGAWVWVILEGMAQVTKETPDGPVTIARLGEGCFIGGFSSLLRKDALRTANVVAASDVQLGVLDADRLSREYESMSSEFKGFLLGLDNRLQRATQTAVDLFMKKPLPKEVLKDMKPFMEKGSSKDELLAITDGNACIVVETSKDNLPLLTLEKNSVFGNVPFVDIGHEPRFASVWASADLKVNKLDTEGMQKEHQQLSGTFKNMIYNIGICISMTTGFACHLRDKK